MISVIILTKNSARTLKDTLESTKNFSEVLVIDTGSSDNTIEIALSFPNCKVERLSFENGFGPLRNKAAELATYDWILPLDSDEVLTGKLSQEILSLTLDPSTVYSILRDNYFNGKHIKGCSGWYPDWVLRLYNKTKTSYSNDAVHERVLSENLLIKKLQFSMKHTPYLSIDAFLTKMQKYSSLFAQQKKGKQLAFSDVLLHTFFAFIKSYFFKGGVLLGKEGYIISSYNAQCTYYKYLKLLESNGDIRGI